MASDKKILTCANDPNFAIICTFFHKFSKPLNLGHPNIQLLQEWLEDIEEVSSGLKQLHIKLLRKLRKTVHETAWETALSKFCWFYSAQDAWEIERFGYKKASLRVKLRVLRELVESQFERNGKFRSITQTMTADELRTQPIGRDKLGHSYWLAQDPDCNLRVFQEHLDEEIWQVVATNRDELVTLISRLRGNEVVLPSLVGAIDEDSSSNSCSGNVIKPPPPEERDESQDDDAAIIQPNDKTSLADVKSEQNNEKIPNIKIKFEKVIENNDSEKDDSKIFSKIEKVKIKNDNQTDKDEIDEEEFEEGEEEYDEVDDEDDENITEEECEDNTVEDKTTNIDKKIILKNNKKEPIKKIIDSDKKVKPLIISHSKIALATISSDDKCGNISSAAPSLSKKRSLVDMESDNKVTEDLTVVKKPRPTLLDTKRKKNISKYEKFKDDSEDEDDEEEDCDDEEEEGEEEDDAEEEAGEEEDEEDDTEDEEVGEAIEEKVLIVKGLGSGKNCKSIYQGFLDQSNYSNSIHENIVGDIIEEEVFYVFGEGSGAECLVGNINKESESKSPPKATFYFGEPGCLKLSPVKKKPPPSVIFTAPNEETVDKKLPISENEQNKDSVNTKDENNINLKNGENENITENKDKIIPEIIDENHTNKIFVEDKTKESQNSKNNETVESKITVKHQNDHEESNEKPTVTHQNEPEESIEKPTESTSKDQQEFFEEKVDKILIEQEENNLENNIKSQIEISETNNDSNNSNLLEQKKSDEVKLSPKVHKNISSMCLEKIKIPEILITDNEAVNLVETCTKVDTEINAINIQETTLPTKMVTSRKTLDAPEELKNTIQDNTNCIIEKFDENKLFENNEKICETPLEDTDIINSMNDKFEEDKVLLNIKKEDITLSDSIKIKADEPSEGSSKSSEEIESSEKESIIEKSAIEFSELEKQKDSISISDSEIIKPATDCTQSNLNLQNIVNDSITPENSETPEKNSEDSKCLKPISFSDSNLAKNPPLDDTNVQNIVKSEVVETRIDSLVPLKIVPQSPTMPKSPSSSISNTLKPEEATKPQKNVSSSITNRKRRLSPVAGHNTPPEKPRRISESSETDLNSENVDGEFVEEENNENLYDDVGAKRARFRLKIVNTDLRKKIEAQRKIESKDNGSSSSGEEERPRKKLSPRKAVIKNQFGETSTHIEKIGDENKLDKTHFDLINAKSSTDLNIENTIKSKNIIDEEVEKSIDVKKKLKENLESHLTSQSTETSNIHEKIISGKIINKKGSPNKLADKIEFLKQSKEKNLEKSTPTIASSTVIQHIALSSNKETVTPTKHEGMTIKKRISPKKIEDKIEILKKNIEKSVNLSNTQNNENNDMQDLGRTRKRSSPPKKIDELSKDINPTESSLNLESEMRNRLLNKLQINKQRYESKDVESDEEIPRKRTISEESSDLKTKIVNLNENKTKLFEGHSSTDEDRSRKRTICENQSVEQITQQPVEKSSKTIEANDVPPENLEFNTKKREAARKIAEEKVKIEIRNLEEDDRPKKRTITCEGEDQYEVKRSEKLSKIEKSISSSEKILELKDFSAIHISQEQILPEDLSRKGAAGFPINKNKALAVLGCTEERVKIKFPENESIETIDKKLKLSSAVSQLSQKSSDIQKIALDSEETEKNKIIAPINQNSPESEVEKSKKPTINNTDEKKSSKDNSVNEIKKDNIDEVQSLKTCVSPPEKIKMIERNEEKIKIVVKTCSVSDSIPNLSVLYERVVSPESSKTATTSCPAKHSVSNKKYLEANKKSNTVSVKKSPEPIKSQENLIDNKKEPESVTVSGTVKTRHTRRAGDSEPLLELTLAQTKRKSRQSISQISQKVTTSAICPPTGKKPKKDDKETDSQLEFVECKIEAEEEKFNKESDNNKLEELSLKKETEIHKNDIDKTESTPTPSTKDSVGKSSGRQQRRKREIDISNIIDTESEITPMRQSRRIAQLKIREEAERRKLEEIALKKMKEDLKRKKKEEKKGQNDDPTVVTEPSEPSDSDYKDDSDVEFKKKLEKKKKGKKSGWSSGSNEEDDHDVDDDDLFKYPASDHGSPLFKSDHEFSPESDIEDESQVVPLKRARTARKEGESVDQRTGIKENDIDESCQKCGKSDHPEWILLCDKCDKGYHCSCLSPVLFIIPEGDWFCPPCQQEQLIAALEKHLEEFDNLILSKKLEEEERVKTLELEAAENERQKELDALEAAENELEGRSSCKKKSSTASKNRRRKANDDNGDNNSQDSENETKSSDGSSDEESDSRKKRNERRNQWKNSSKTINRKKSGRIGSSESSGSSTNSSERGRANKSSATDSDDEPIYKLRKRRQTNISYRFNDYDELINRAIKKDENQGIIYSDEEAEDEEGAGNLGRGKDITTILEADKEEKARQKQKDDEEKGVKSEEKTEKKADSNIKEEEDSGSDFEPLKVKQKSIVNKRQRKKKNRKLNCLDISSEDDGSDEDFRTSSEDDDDEEESYSVSSGSDSSLEAYKRRSKHKGSRKTSRRAARERKKIRDFVVDGSDDESEDEAVKPKLKKKRKQVESDFTESDLEEDDDEELSEDLDSDELCDDDSTDSDHSGWRPSKRKKQKTATIQKKKPSGKSATTVNIIGSGKSPRQSIGKEVPKIVAAKKKPRRIDDDEKPFKASGVVKKNRQRLSESGSSSSSDGAGGRKTRGRRLFYMDDYDDEESSDGGIKPGVKRPDTPPEEREKFIKRQEEIKRMLAEKNVSNDVKETTKSTSSAEVSQSTKAHEKTGAGDSLSAVPLSVIRAAKALDVDYLQRKGETGEQSENEDDDDDVAAASAFGDDLPDDFNPDDMDEEAIAKIMEEEDFPQHQQMKALPLPGDVLRHQHKKLSTPPKVPTQPLLQQQTSVIQDPIMRKRLPMPTFHPLMRLSHPSSGGLSHLPLLQSALTNPVGMTQPPQQLTPGVPMSHHRPSQQPPIIQSSQAQISPQTSKPRGRRKKITPLRDPVEKAAAVAAATTTSTSTTTNQNPILQNSLIPTNLSGKDILPVGSVSALPTPAIQPPISTGNLNVAQPPQLYKPPTNSPQPSVITRMPQMPPRPRFPDQVSRFYPPPGGTGVPPNQLLPPHHRPPPGSLRHSLMPMHHPAPPPHHTLRPSYASGPPPLRPGNQPLRSGNPPASLRHGSLSGPRGLPPATSPTAINLGNGLVREQSLGRQQQTGPSQFPSEQFAAPHRSRHPAPSLTPYRPPLYGSPGYPPAPPPQHAVGSYPPGSPYGSYYPPPSLGPSTHSSAPSNSVIVAAAAAVSAAAASTIVVTPSRLSIPTSVVHHPSNQQQPPPPPSRTSSGHSNVPPPPHRPTKVTTLETYNAKRTPPPLDLQQNQQSALLHPRDNNDDDDDDDDGVNPIAGRTANSGASEFSGLVSYFSSQHDEF